jgi:hypothetical protein
MTFGTTFAEALKCEAMSVGMRAKESEPPFHLYHVRTYLQFLEEGFDVCGGCTTVLMKDCD